MPAALSDTLNFLRDLRDNNNRPWFTENRARYDRARAAFEDFIVDVMQNFSEIEDLSGVTPAQVMFRINRDVRFSKDPSPYKIAMSALLGKQGRKTEGRVYYIQIQPDNNSIIASGQYNVSSTNLKIIRDAIAADARPLRAIIDSPDFKRNFGAMSGEQLITAPKGYPKDHPDIDLLRYKSFGAVHPLTDEQVLADDLVEHILHICKALKPFATYFDNVLRAHA